MAVAAFLLHVRGVSADAIACGWDGRVYVGLPTFSAAQGNLHFFDEAGNSIAAPTQISTSDGGQYTAQLRLSGGLTRVITAHSDLTADGVSSLAQSQSHRV